MDIIESARNVSAAAITKYNPTTLYIIGGGVNIRGIDDLLSESFGMPVKNMGDFAAATALSDYVWGANAARAKSYVARGDRARKLISFLKPKSSGRKQKKIFIPIMPSSMAFDMTNPDTYSLFKSGDISMIHIDIADGFFVNRITGGIEELKAIRAKTDAHLHVHLMTESPTTWAAAAASAGADTIIVSTNTAGVRGAIRQIQGQKKRAGIALGPDNSVEILKPILKEIDDILIMSVPPGRGGQEFDMTALHKISVLANTRKKYGLKYKIAVDGGINPDTAKLCWAAGADFLISGSYLASAHDFPLAVQSLLRGG